MITTLPTKMKPIMEEYYGSTPNLNNALSNLSVIVNQLRKKSGLELAQFNPTETKENINICKAFEKEFGFAKMDIYWDNSSLPNAFTIPGGCFINKKPGHKLQNKKKKDKYYDKDHSYQCYMEVINEIVHNYELTDRETMGIMLHEIGHNFDNQFCVYVNEMVFGILTFGITDIVKILITYLEKGKMFLVKTFPTAMYLIDIIRTLPYHLTLVNLPSPALLYKLSPDGLIQLIIGTKQEYYADSFAAKYGFGPDLASALSKLDDRTKSAGFARRQVAQIPVLRTFHDLIAGPCEMVFQLIDVHPENENRITSIKNNLKKDYNDPEIPASLKPEIKRQIEMCDKYIELDKKNAESNGMLFGSLKKMIMYDTNLSSWWTS